jgi:TRAP-type C4-dicarboxylate transport system substrate-binding protein
MDGHTWSENMLLMNTKTLHSLSEEHQQILRMAGLHGARADRTAEAFMSRVMGMDILQANMEVYAPTAEEIKKFQDAAQPAVIEWLKGEVGAEVVDDFLEAVKEAEMALGYK